MKNNKWSVKSFSEEPIHVVLLVSRNKDNQHIPDFKERRMSFITHKTIEELNDDFTSFVNKGIPGEMCRMYYSVNARNPVKIHHQLLHFLIDNPDFNLCSIDPKLAGIAAQKECALEKKWMFDFDIDDETKAEEFEDDLIKYCLPKTIIRYKTPHGFAFVIDEHFDTRELINKWGRDVTLKRDDLLCVDWRECEVPLFHGFRFAPPPHF